MGTITQTGRVQIEQPDGSLRALTADDLRGPTGAPGRDGVDGRDGADGEGAFPPLVHEQTSPTDDLLLAHPFNGYPRVLTLDSGGDEIEGVVQYPDADHVRITFPFPFAFRAVLTI